MSIEERPDCVLSAPLQRAIALLCFTPKLVALCNHTCHTSFWRP